MATKKLEVTITFERPEVSFLVCLAKRENKSISDLVKELTLEALEDRQDWFLSKIAEQLDVKGAKKYTREDAWM